MELEHTQLEHGGELVYLQQNRDGMEFSCKKTLGGKGLKPYPPLVMLTAEDGGLLHRKMTVAPGLLGLRTAGGHPTLPS